MKGFKFGSMSHACMVRLRTVTAYSMALAIGVSSIVIGEKCDLKGFTIFGGLFLAFCVATTCFRLFATPERLKSFGQKVLPESVYKHYSQLCDAVLRKKSHSVGDLDSLRRELPTQSRNSIVSAMKYESFESISKSVNNQRVLS